MFTCKKKIKRMIQIHVPPRFPMTVQLRIIFYKKLEIFFFLSTWKLYVVASHQSCLTETVLKMVHIRYGILGAISKHYLQCIFKIHPNTKVFKVAYKKYKNWVATHNQMALTYLWTEKSQTSMRIHVANPLPPHTHTSYQTSFILGL